MSMLKEIAFDDDNAKRLVFESTYYSLFLYLLYDDSWKKRDYLFFDNRISDETLNRLKMHANVLSESALYMPLIMPKFYKNPLKYYARKLQQQHLFSHYDVCFGNVREINNWLINIKRVQIEDGTLTRNELMNGAKNRGYVDAFFAFLKLKESTKTRRTDKYIIACEVSALEIFKNKVETINFFELWQGKTPQQREEILDVFGVKSVEFNGITKHFSILFTQPWSEAFNYGEEKKIRGYKMLIKELGIDESMLVIKPHPLETTDYSVSFPHSTILKASFPCELMPILNVRVDKVVSLSSTAGSCFDGLCEEVIYALAPEYFEFPRKLSDRINNMKL